MKIIIKLYDLKLKCIGIDLFTYLLGLLLLYNNMCWFQVTNIANNITGYETIAVDAVKRTNSAS